MFTHSGRVRAAHSCGKSYVHLHIISLDSHTALAWVSPKAASEMQLPAGSSCRPGQGTSRGSQFTRMDPAHQTSQEPLEKSQSCLPGEERGCLIPAGQGHPRGCPVSHTLRVWLQEHQEVPPASPGSWESGRCWAGVLGTHQGWDLPRSMLPKPPGTVPVGMARRESKPKGLQVIPRGAPEVESRLLSCHRPMAAVHWDRRWARARWPRTPVLWDLGGARVGRLVERGACPAQYVAEESCHKVSHSENDRFYQSGESERLETGAQRATYRRQQEPDRLRSVSR